MTVVGIVPAGGSGERLGADRPKAFVVCAGRPMVEWSLDALRPACSRIVLAVPPRAPLVGGPPAPSPLGAARPPRVSRAGALREALGGGPASTDEASLV